MFEVTDLEDDARILPLLEGDRCWAAYALSDLDEPSRQHTRFIAALRNGGARSLLVLFTPPGLAVVSAFGSPDGVRAILARAQSLPLRAIITSLEDCVPAIAERYAVSNERAMLRMVVDAGALQAAPRVDASIRRLAPRDLPQLAQLYGQHPEMVFQSRLLADGIYWGADIGDKLVAVAGTHTISPRFRIGTIGGVYTDPSFRGRGLATALTSAVARALVDADMSLLALNVRVDNVPAVAAYRRLGFSPHNTFWEANGDLRT